MAASSHRITATSVFLFVPNLIGYARVVLAIAAFYHITEPTLFLTLYGLSCLLDVADGYAARYLNQCSRLGAVLDMVTDRSTTAGLLCHLCAVYPRWTLLFQLLVALDLSSHYMHMYSALSTGETSHKSIGNDRNWLLRLYYTSRTVMFFACGLNESFFMALYMLHYQPSTVIVAGTRVSVWLVAAAVSAPICAFKQTMNLIQLAGAAKTLAELDAKAAVAARPKSS